MVIGRNELGIQFCELRESANLHNYVIFCKTPQKRISYLLLKKYFSICVSFDSSFFFGC